VSHKKNLESFGLAQSQYFNQATLNQAVAGLKEEYLSRGKQSVQITPKGERGKIEIEYLSQKDLTRILDVLEIELDD